MEAEERDFTSSKLGTKEFWDEAYQNELSNFKDIGDVGEIWFGESSQRRVIGWVEKNCVISPDNKILDIGCGNGALLIELSKRGYKNLYGIDYCEGAVTLANQIAVSEGITDVIFQTDNILDPNDGSCLRSNLFELCLDKGTYDAISLMPNNSPRETYRNTVWDVLKQDGRLIMTSCNWTKEQLINQFQNKFTLEAEIPTPKFQFGGASGSTVTSLVFRKKQS